MATLPVDYERAFEREGRFINDFGLWTVSKKIEIFERRNHLRLFSDAIFNTSGISSFVLTTSPYNSCIILALQSR